LRSVELICWELLLNALNIAIPLRRALLIATNFTERMYECTEASVDRNMFAPRANVVMARVDAIAAALIAAVLGQS
jgi:hypothetical protein